VKEIIMRGIALLAACAGLVALAGPVTGQKTGQAAPDFPPGSFTDGNRYQLSELQGKLVVLYFFEKQ
jgi:hypothetical protein